MDTEAIQALFATLGFDPALAAHAIVAVPAFKYVAMPLTKKLSFVPKQWEKAMAIAITTSLDLLIGTSAGTGLAFPVASAATVGAIFAMVWYDLQNKKEDAAAGPTKKQRLAEKRKKGK